MIYHSYPTIYIYVVNIIILISLMGKLNKQSDSDNENRMEIEQPQLPAKRKLIKKKAQKPTIMVNEQSTSVSKSKSKSLANKSIKKYSKMVNLHKAPVDLIEKQGIFKKIVSDMKGEKKVSRKLRKKQRVQIKKELRKELQEKLPIVNVPQASSGQAMQEQKSTVRKQKFEEKKAVQQFKKTMGMKFSSLKNMLAHKIAS